MPECQTPLQIKCLQRNRQLKSHDQRQTQEHRPSNIRHRRRLQYAGNIISGNISTTSARPMNSWHALYVTDYMDARHGHLVHRQISHNWSHSIRTAVRHSAHHSVYITEATGQLLIQWRLTQQITPPVPGIQ